MSYRGQYGWPAPSYRARGFGDISDPNAVLVGTVLRLTGNVYTSAFGIPVPLVTQASLDAIAGELRKRAYRVRRNTSTYSQITFDVETRAEKVSIEGVLADFIEATNAGLAKTWNGAGDELQNPSFTVIYNPRDHNGQPAPENVSGGGAGDDDDDKDKTPKWLMPVAALLLLGMFFRR